jgi:nitroimidazol reductase NimA-like FMN-containing flavoprotein (pyridoxamine 5'-phosphate oxidase superfamily)
MSDKECWNALGSAGFGRLACARDGQPYIVPIFFAVTGDHVYSFSMTGQKLEWMRDNPRVCLEIDSVTSWNDWTSVIAFGRYQELPETPDWHAERRRAHRLLEQRAMWWQPGAVMLAGNDAREGASPVFFRIIVERMTGHRGAEGPAPVRPEQQPRDSWLKQLFRAGEVKR